MTETIWKPHVTVAAVARRAGRFLLVEEEVLGRRCLNQPAGHLEEGESLFRAVVRETLEETGWGFRPEGIVGLYRWRSLSDGKTFLRTAFHGQCSQRHPDQALDEGIIGPVWLTVEEIAAREAELRSPLVLRVVQDYLNGRRYPLELLVDLDGEEP